MVVLALLIKKMVNVILVIKFSVLNVVYYCKKDIDVKKLTYNNYKCFKMVQKCVLFVKYSYLEHKAVIICFVLNVNAVLIGKL